MTSRTQPDRRRFLSASALSLTPFALPGLLRSRRTDRPNFLFVLSDQQHFEALGHVDPFFETPAIDGLAETGTRFTRAFCSTPQCSPSRASILTGRYPHKVGMMNNHGTPGGAEIGGPTVGDALRAAGYHTGWCGKWHLDTESTTGWVEASFSENDQRSTGFANKFLAARKADGQPFALFVSFIEPHGILSFRASEVEPPDFEVPLDETWEKEDLTTKPPSHLHFMENYGGSKLIGKPRGAWQKFRSFYRQRVKMLDDDVGKVLRALERLGLEDNTVVIFTSDHGEMDTRHRMVFKGPFLYEHVLRVPMIVRTPEAFGGTPGGVVDDHSFMNLDFVPTLREFAGLEPVETDGLSTFGRLTGGTSEVRETVFAQYHGKSRW